VILVLRVMCSNICARASLARLAVLLLLLVGTLRNLSCLCVGMRVSQPHTHDSSYARLSRSLVQE